MLSSLMLISQKKAGDPFTMTIDTTLGTGDSFQLPLRSGYAINATVDWGDGSSDLITTYNQAQSISTTEVISLN